MGLHLFSLPNELLARIVGEVLSPLSLPELLIDKSPLTISHVSFARRLGGHGMMPRTTFFEDSQKLASLVPGILFTNKRLREVGLSFLRSSGGRDCAVDVVLFQENKLVTSWRSLPACTYLSDDELEPMYNMSKEAQVNGLENSYKSHHLDTVTCTMRPWGVHKLGVRRIKETGESYLRSEYGGFGVGDGGPPAIVWTLYDTLFRFVRFGPRFTSHTTDTTGDTHEVKNVRAPTGKKQKIHVEDDLMSRLIKEPSLEKEFVGKSPRIKTEEIEDDHWSVRTFIFDVLTPESDGHLEFGGPLSTYRLDEEARRLLREGGDWHPGRITLDPKKLQWYIRDYILLLLGFAHAYGEILYEHVGHIVIKFDGVEVDRFDLAERLLRLDETWKHSYHKEHDDATFSVWKPRVLVRRARFGLEEPFNSIKDEIDIALNSTYKDWASCSRSLRA